MVLLTSADSDPKLAQGQFAVECEAVRMKVSTSKSKAMVLCQKIMYCSLRVVSDFLPKVKKFKYRRVLIKAFPQ